MFGMPEWLVGVVGSVAGAGVLALIGVAMKRAALYERSYRWGATLRKIGLGYDLPVIGGDAEVTFKERCLSFISDFFRGMARGIAGLPMQNGT